MTMNSEKSCNCGRSSQNFLLISQRPFGIESRSKNAFGEKSQRAQLLQILSPGPAPKVTVSLVTVDPEVAPALGVINADQRMAGN